MTVLPSLGGWGTVRTLPWLQIQIFALIWVFLCRLVTPSQEAGSWSFFFFWELVLLNKWVLECSGGSQSVHVSRQEGAA